MDSFNDQIEPYKQYSYGPHPRQVVSIYDHIAPFMDTLQLPTLVFIHGGAWCDSSNTDRDADTFSKHLNKTIPLCSVDYRLSDVVKHPVFTEDVVMATKKCLEKLGSRKVSFVGHSVGAMLVLQALEKMDVGVTVDKVYLVDGIYDMEDMLEEYPDYEGFVKDAHDDYKEVKLSLENLKDVEVHILHSYEDELLSLRQTSWLQKQLSALELEFYIHVAHWGKHNNVYINPKLAEYVNRTYC